MLRDWIPADLLARWQATATTRVTDGRDTDPSDPAVADGTRRNGRVMVRFDEVPHEGQAVSLELPGSLACSNFVPVNTSLVFANETVSRVLSGKRFVSDSVRKAIGFAIATVGYVHTMTARNLASQRTRAVGLIKHKPHPVFLEDSDIGAILPGRAAATIVFHLVNGKRPEQTGTLVPTEIVWRDCT